MKSSIQLLFLIFLSVNAYSQLDSIELSKLNAQSSKSERITKYRSLIMDNVIVNNKAKTKELFYDVIQKLDNDFYIALYPQEKWVICFWLGEYFPIISEIANTDTGVIARMKTKVRPGEDQLYEILIKKINDEKDTVTTNITSSNALTLEDKSFLLLLLRTFTEPDSHGEYQERINEAATLFLKEYPGNRFENYVRNYIRYQYKTGTLSFGMELYSGASILSNKTSSCFRSGGTLGIGFIWGIGKLHINTRAAFVFSGLKQDVIYNGYSWQKGERVQLFLPEISIGYKFQAMKKISISPIIGIGWFSAAPYDYDKQKNAALKDIEISSEGSPIAGFDLGWEFKDIHYYNYFYRRLMHAYYSCNFRYTVQPVRFAGTYNYMDGIAHNISASIKFGFGGTKRDY